MRPLRDSASYMYDIAKKNWSKNTQADKNSLCTSSQWPSGVMNDFLASKKLFGEFT